MAFMNTPTSAGAGPDRMPVLAYDARSGRLAFHDRVQGSDGKWGTVKTDVSRLNPVFAVDFGRLEVGWVHFADARAPLWAMAPFGQPAVPEPAAPAAAADGKAIRYKPGFRVPVISRAIGGVREFAGNAAALIAGMNELHTDYEAAAEARAGKLPLVKLIDTREVRSGQACNYQPIFEIVSWVDRPAALGPRTVPPPGAVNGHAPAAPAARRDIDDAHAQRLASAPARAPSHDDRAQPVRHVVINGHAAAGGGGLPARARFAAQVA